jgi:hypothetical protein
MDIDQIVGVHLKKNKDEIIIYKVMFICLLLLFLKNPLKFQIPKKEKKGEVFTIGYRYAIST